MYAIIDDQSNRSLASPAFFDMFNILDKPETAVNVGVKTNKI
jgi:hypothetical protein